MISKIVLTRRLIPTIFTLIILGTAGQLMADDCTSADDCLRKAQNSNFTKSAIAMLDQGLKYAKKEKKNPSRLYFERGKKRYNLGASSAKDALKDFDAAIKADPDFYWPYSWKGALYQVKLKDYDKAKKWLNDVVEIFPEDPRAYYDRAHNHRYYNNIDLAFADFENAYNLLTIMMEEAEDFDENTKGNICRWYAIAYMKKNNLYVYDQKTLEILEQGEAIAPTSPLLLGDLAMAYYDNDQFSKASEIARRAEANDAEKMYNRVNSGGAFVVGMQYRKDKDLYNAASFLTGAMQRAKQPHPAISFYFALAQWEYCLSKYDTNPNLWQNNIGRIKSQLQQVLKIAPGTKYESLVDTAKKNLQLLNQ